MDDPSNGAAEIRRLAPEFVQQPLATDTLAFWAAYYDEPETALMLLRRNYVTWKRTASTTLSMWRPLFADMRKLPGFKDLVREMGLVDYWYEYEWSDFCRPVGDDDFECE